METAVHLVMKVIPGFTGETARSLRGKASFGAILGGQVVGNLKGAELTYAKWKELNVCEL